MEANGPKNLSDAGVRTEGTFRIRALRFLSVLLAFSGLALLCPGLIRCTGRQEPLLRLRSAAQPRADRPLVPDRAAPLVRLADMTAGRAGERITVSGLITRVSIPRPGSNAPYILTLEDGGAEVPAVFWGAVLQAQGGRLPMPGQAVRMQGEIDLYNGTVQLKVRDPWVLLAKGGEK